MIHSASPKQQPKDGLEPSLPATRQTTGNEPSLHGDHASIVAKTIAENLEVQEELHRRKMDDIAYQHARDMAELEQRFHERMAREEETGYHNRIYRVKSGVEALTKRFGLSPEEATQPILDAMAPRLILDAAEALIRGDL